MSNRADAVFARGCFGDMVKVLQRALAQEGLYTGTVDGGR